jgi:hypothetical protein
MTNRGAPVGRRSRITPTTSGMTSPARRTITVSPTHTSLRFNRNGHLVDVRLSETRNLVAAKAFFRSARAVTGVLPDRVTSDGHGSYPRAIACELGEDVTHRTNQYLNNHLEQDHRGIKQRVRPMLHAGLQALHLGGPLLSRP